MQQEEQYIIVSGRSIKISKNLQNVVQENDNLSEKVLITMDRFYDGADFDSKNINMYIKTPVNNELIVNLNSVKTTSADMISFDFVFTKDMTVDRGWLDIVFIVTDQSGFKWSSQQANKAIFVGSNFTTHKQPVPNEYYVDLEEYRKEILGYVNDAKNSVNASKLEADRAKTEADRAWGADFSKHVTIDSVAKTNFDFIEGKVVQDGLLHYFKNNKFTNFSYDITKKFTYISKYKVLNSDIWGNLINSYNPQSLLIETMPNFISRLYMHNEADKTATGLRYETEGVLVVISDGENIKITLGGKTIVKNFTNTNIVNFISSSNSTFTDALFYNRQITPQEIQHNLSVLNSSPSISQLQTTDSTGKTSILALGSDEDHVEMSTGRTLRQEYMGLLKRDGKEFTAVDNKIEVNNGLEARVISAEIKGQTVKSYFNAPKIEELNYYESIIPIPLEAGRKYVMTYKITSDTTTGFCGTMSFIKSDDTALATIFDTGVNFSRYGEKKVTFTATGQENRLKIWKRKSPSTPTIYTIENINIVDESQGHLISPQFSIPFGLSSTQAIISNNGMKYPFYATEEDKNLGKVIELGGVGDVRDTLEIKDDGSLVVNKPIVRNRLTSKTLWNLANSMGGVSRFYSLNYDTGVDVVKKKNGLYNLTCSSYETNDGNLHIVGVGGYDRDGRVYIKLKDETANTVAMLNNYLDNNEIYIEYEVETPTTTPIPKELVPTILTDKINILSVDSAVKPSSFKAIVPVDKITSLETRLSQLEAIVNAPKNMKIQANYVDDEYNKSIKQLEGMM